MDISGFLSGRFLGHADLPAPTQVWTIRQVAQQVIRSEPKICVLFDQHQKWFPLNKTNLRAVANGYGLLSEGWVGRPLEVYRDKTVFENSLQDCVRVRVPQLTMQASQTPVAYQHGPSQLAGALLQPVVTPGQPPQQSPQSTLPAAAKAPAVAVLATGPVPPPPQLPSAPTVPSVPWAQ